MVPAPVRGRAFGDIFSLVQEGGVSKTRAKRAFCTGEKLAQVPKTRVLQKLLTAAGSTAHNSQH